MKELIIVLSIPLQEEQLEQIVDNDVLVLPQSALPSFYHSGVTYHSEVKEVKVIGGDNDIIIKPVMITDKEK